VLSGSLNHLLALLGRNALPAPLRLVGEREQLPVGHAGILSSSVTTSYVPYAPASNSRARKTARHELGDATRLEEFVIDPLTIDSAGEGL
jgi:hypothetical protein